MQIRRFKVESLDNDVLRIVGSEAKHAAQVLRLEPGTEVILFDGRGHEACGRITAVSRQAVDIEIVERREVPLQQHPGLILAVATPKANRADWMIEKCAELGVRELRLIKTRYGETLPGEGKLERWRRKIDAAAKQARLAWTPTLHTPANIDDVLGEFPTNTPLWYGHAGEDCPSFTIALQERTIDEAQNHLDILCIGPEGGFTDQERTLIEDRGGHPVRLAVPILRIETAAIAGAAIHAAWSLSL